MASSIFITGASGFIGSRFLQRLDPLKHDHIFCLCRSQIDTPPLLSTNGKLQVIRGSIKDVDAYEPYLSQCETVVHLAAATGKADRDEHFAVNAKGTALFVERCARAGVKNFLHISTIAVNYPDKSHYYYAQSKELGELAVKNSGLCYTIVRPTIVMGEDAAIWQSLAKLAKGPIVPIFGDGRAKIQPIFVDDLIEFLLQIVDEAIFQSEVYELGGPEVISFEDFLRQINTRFRRREPRIVHIPVKQLQGALSLLESHFGSALPVTAGQLSAFNNDGTARMNGRFEQRSTTLKGIQDMLDLVMRRHRDSVQAERLEAECKAFTSYLVGQAPNDYVQRKYRDAHARDHIFGNLDSSAFERFLVRVATLHPVLTRMVDTYTAILAKRALFRKKMILSMAILESSAPTYSQFDVPDAARPATVFLRLFQKGVAFGLYLLFSAILFLPVHAASSIRSKMMARGE